MSLRYRADFRRSRLVHSCYVNRLISSSFVFPAFLKLHRSFDNLRELEQFPIIRLRQKVVSSALYPKLTKFWMIFRETFLWGFIFDFYFSEKIKFSSKTLMGVRKEATFSSLEPTYNKKHFVRSYRINEYHHYCIVWYHSKDLNDFWLHLEKRPLKIVSHS